MKDAVEKILKTEKDMEAAEKKAYSDSEEIIRLAKKEAEEVLKKAKDESEQIIKERNKEAENKAEEYLIKRRERQVCGIKKLSGKAEENMVAAKEEILKRILGR